MRVLAILARPGADTMRTVPLAIETLRGIRTSGLRDDYTLRRSDLDELIRKGSAIPLDILAPVAPVSGVWIGWDFGARQFELDAPIARFDTGVQHIISSGPYRINDARLVLGPPDENHAAIDRWLDETFALVLARKSRPLAELRAKVFLGRLSERLGALL